MSTNTQDLATKWGVTAAAAALHSDAVVWDMTLPWRYGDAKLRLGTLESMRASGYTFVSLTLAADAQSLEETVKAIAKERAYFQKRPEQFVLVHTAADILRAHNEKKLGIGFHFQGTNALAGDLNMVEAYYRLGVRHMLMAFNARNLVGDGCHEPENAGLSMFGRALVAEMERVGMFVDLSHTGQKTTLDVMDIATRPVIFSHSNPKGIVDHPRNISDEQIKGCARLGGVIGINGMSVALKDYDISTASIVRAIDYVVQLVGIDHVGIVLDSVYDMAGLMSYLTPGETVRHPKGQGYEGPLFRFAVPEQVPQVTEQLLGLGYSEKDVSAVLGGNWLRIAQEVWR